MVVIEFGATILIVHEIVNISVNTINNILIVDDHVDTKSPDAGIGLADKATAIFDPSTPAPKQNVNTLSTALFALLESPAPRAGACWTRS